MIDFLLHSLFLGAVIFVMAETLPTVRVRSYVTAVLVAIVYSLINATLGAALKFVGFPFVIITGGLFLLLVNTFMVWLTDQFFDDFEIEGVKATLICALIITVASTLLGWIF